MSSNEEGHPSILKESYYTNYVNCTPHKNKTKMEETTYDAKDKKNYNPTEGKEPTQGTTSLKDEQGKLAIPRMTADSQLETTPSGCILGHSTSGDGMDCGAWIIYISILGFYTARVLGWGSYGYDRCSVLVLTGVLKFLLSPLLPSVNVNVRLVSILSSGVLH